MKVRDVIKLIEADGWYFLRQRGQAGIDQDEEKEEDQ